MNDHDLLIRIDENVIAMKQHAEAHQKQDDAIHEQQDARIRALEDTKQSQKGAITVISAVVSAVWAIGFAVFEIIYKK